MTLMASTIHLHARNELNISFNAVFPSIELLDGFLTTQCRERRTVQVAQDFECYAVEVHFVPLWVAAVLL